MALTESKIISQVTLLPESNTIQVRWDNLIKRDEEIISRVPHRCSYSVEQKDQFIAEVENGQAYVAAMGW